MYALRGTVPEGAMNFVPADSKLQAALVKQNSDINNAVVSHLRQLDRGWPTRRSTRLRRKKQLIDQVYTRAVREQNDSIPVLRGPILKLVHLLQRLKLLEGAVKLLRSDGGTICQLETRGG